MIELLFTEDEPDQGVGGRFYESWKDRCTRRDQIRVQRISVSFGGGQAPPPRAPPVPTERLWLDDAWTVVQVGPGILTVHMVRQEKPYPGFELFSKRLSEAIELYASLVNPAGLARATMRYINRLDIPKRDDGSLADWLQVGVWLPDAFTGRVSGVSVQAVVQVPSANAELHYALRAGEVTTEVLQLWLDLRVTSLNDHSPTLEALPAWLKSAHDDGIIDGFEGSITDDARDAFGILEGQ